MIIFHIFSGLIILVILTRIFVIIFNSGSGDDKVTRLFGTFIALLLVSISWALIYAFFGYTSDTIKNDVNQQKKSSIVKFNNE